MSTGPVSVILGAAGAYAIAAGLLTMLPGPQTAVVLATALDGGRRAAARAAVGVAVALIAWGIAASLGVAAILRASAEVYAVFRAVCVAYLLWLAARSLVAAICRHRTAAAPEMRVHGPKARGFRRALVTGLLNPKLGVFFVVFMPQFVPSSLPMTMLFASIQAAEALAWYLLLGTVAAAARRVLSRPPVRRSIQGLTAAVFLFFAGRLALER